MRLYEPQIHESAYNLTWNQNHKLGPQSCFCPHTTERIVSVMQELEQESMKAKEKRK